MKYCVVLICLVAGVLAIPVQESQTAQSVRPHGANTDKIVIVAEDPVKQEALVRKARQIFEDINIDIIQGGYGGGYGYPFGYGAYGGYPGFGGGYGGYYGGYGGYGGFGYPIGYGFYG